MKTLFLGAHGNFLASQFAGEVVRDEITRDLHSGKVIVDFSEVIGIGPSFADECFGEILRERGLKVFGRDLRFTGANQDIRTVVQFVLSERRRVAKQ